MQIQSHKMGGERSDRSRNSALGSFASSRIRPMVIVKRAAAVVVPLKRADAVVAAGDGAVAMTKLNLSVQSPSSPGDSPIPFDFQKQRSRADSRLLLHRRSRSQSQSGLEAAPPPPPPAPTLRPSRLLRRRRCPGIRSPLPQQAVAAAAAAAPVWCWFVFLSEAMIGLHLVRKLKNGVSGFRGFSALTGSGQSLQTCVIRGSCQDIVLPGALFESLDDHVAQFPLVTKIPHGGVITLQANQPYLINEHWRPIFRSGFLHSSFCQSENDCIANPFDFTNVGVLKGLNLLAFKKFNRVEGKTNSNHLDYCAFVEDVFRRYCLGSNLQHQFPECRHFIDAIINGADEDVLRHHSFFLGDEEAANFFSDNHRLLRQEFKHRGREAKARAILVDLEGCYNNFTVVKNCQNHLPLQYLLGSHSPSKLGHPGSAVVDLHRIAVQHAIEDNVMTPAMQDYPHESYLLNNYQRVDLIRALRYMYPKYGGEALVSFKNHSVLEHLQMARRLPTPTIYNYVSPVSGPKVEP